MKPQVLTMLALRVVAVYIASRSFVYLAQIAVYLAYPPANVAGMLATTTTSYWLVGLGGPLVVAIIIWFCAPRLARLAARSTATTKDPGVDIQGLLTATLAAAGTIIFIAALPRLVANILVLLGPATAPREMSMLVGSILQCVLGIALAVGSGVTSRLLLWLRYAGTGASGL